MALNEKTVKWLGRNCPGSFKGKTVLITGANSGVGFKSAEIMAYLGARVIMACRSESRANAAKEAILRDDPDADITTVTLDLADLSSIDSFADRLIESGEDIDVFLNNAGVFKKPGEKTRDGFELVIGTNYIGAYHLAERLLPYLSGLPHEVIYINTVSIIHKAGTVDYGDFFYENHYNDFSAYARSKLCLAKYSYYKALQYEKTGVRVQMIHPGIAITPLGANAFGKIVKKLSKKLRWLFNTPEKSALALPYVISRDLPVGSITGPRGLLNGWGLPSGNRVIRKVKTGGAELAAFTAEIIKEKRMDTKSDI